MKKPFISVVIPAYNEEAEIAKREIIGPAPVVRSKTSQESHWLQKGF